MRQLLDGLYDCSGWLAAILLVAICGIVLAQVGLNLIDQLTHWLMGRSVGLVIPSYAEFAGFFLAAASFLALASTWRTGGHIRVTLAIERLRDPWRRYAELWCIVAATVITGFFTYHTIALVSESWSYRDVSPGLVPVPLWLPQSAMAFGLAVLTIALIDELACHLQPERWHSPRKTSHRATDQSPRTAS